MYYRTLLAIGNTKASEIISCEQYIFFSLRNHTGRINTKMIIIFYQMINICSFWVETLCQEQKNSEANFCFPRKKWLFFRPKGEKTVFSEGNKCSSQSFFDPGIMFSA